MSSNTRKPPSPKVHPGEYPMLNERFYRAKPAEYLELRLWSLASTLGDANQPTVVSFEDFKLGREAGPTEEQLTRYAALESTVLLHHAAETMLRLYLAHAKRSPCPWLELARLRNFADFKQKVAHLRDELDTDEGMDDAAEVFFWTRVPEPIVGMTDDAWQSHRSALRELLQYCIDVLLDDAPYYNAAKHGLGVGAGRVGMSLGDHDNPILSADGAALSILEQPIANDGLRRWAITTHWVHPKQSMALVGAIVRAIESMWEAARGHYRQPDTDPRKIWFMPEEQIRDLLRIHQKDGITVMTMSEGVVHFEPTSADTK